MWSQSQRRELMTLPNELVALVAKHTLPTGFESFMLTCKRVYALGAPLIAAHDKRKKLWTIFGVDDGNDKQDTSNMTALDFIYAVATNDPLIPAYIIGLNFGSGSMVMPFESNREALNGEAREGLLEARNRGKCQWWNNESTVQKMRDLVTESRYLHASGVNVEDWADKMFDMKDPGNGNLGTGTRPSYAFRMHSLVFILTLLINVGETNIDSICWARGIHLLNDNPGSDEGRMYPELRQVLNYITEKANNYNHGDREGEDTALIKLRMLSQNNRLDEIEDRGIPLCCWKPFLTLDTLKDLCVTEPKTLEIDPVSRFPTPLQSPPAPPSTLVSLPRNPSSSKPGILVLALWFGNICPTSLSRFLNYAAPHLERIVIEWEYDLVDEEDHEGECSWDVREFFGALGRSSGSSLTNLRIGPPLMFAYPKGLVPIESLHEFERLEYLKIPAFCFLGVESEEAFITRGVEVIKAVPRLRDVLPTSLKTLILTIVLYKTRDNIINLCLLTALLWNFDFAASGLSSFHVELAKGNFYIEHSRLPDGSLIFDAFRSVAEKAGARIRYA